MLRLGCERVIGFAIYWFVTRINEHDYRLGMLTYQFTLLSKPVGPGILQIQRYKNFARSYTTHKNPSN